MKRHGKVRSNSRNELEGPGAFSIDQGRFLELEFTSLRQEILQTLARRHRILATGIFGIPAASYGLRNLEAHGFFLFIPFLVSVLVITFVSESNALMRCGGYIKERIESRVEGGQGGWETWLEGVSRRQDKIRRTSDRLMKRAFFRLSLIYYIMGVALFFESDVEFFTALSESYTGVVALQNYLNSQLGTTLDLQMIIVIVSSLVFLVLFLAIIRIMATSPFFSDSESTVI